jgi:hypothetical protein
MTVNIESQYFLWSPTVINVQWAGWWKWGLLSFSLSRLKVQAPVMTTAHCTQRKECVWNIHLCRKYFIMKVITMEIYTLLVNWVFHEVPSCDYGLWEGLHFLLPLVYQQWPSGCGQAYPYRQGRLRATQAVPGQINMGISFPSDAV